MRLPALKQGRTAPVAVSVRDTEAPPPAPVDPVGAPQLLADIVLAQPDTPHGDRPTLVTDVSDERPPLNVAASADPFLADSSAPPPPEDGPLPPLGVKPFGEDLVLAVLVDHTGLVLRTKILIPSRDATTNITYGLALQNSRLSVDPPLAEGEQRWLTVPMTISNPDSVLP